MTLTRPSCPICSRRSFVKTGAFAGMALSLGSGASAFQLPDVPTTANGGTDPYPIPWLDKNGSHNQPAGPKPRAVTHLSFQGSRRPLQHFHRHGHGQSGESDRVRQSDHRLRRDAGRVLGRARNPAGNLHAHMTDVVPGTSGPRQPDSRPSPSHRAFRTLLGRAGTGGRPDYQFGCKHVHARNEGCACRRSATLAGD